MLVVGNKKQTPRRDEPRSCVKKFLDGGSSYSHCYCLAQCITTFCGNKVSKGAPNRHKTSGQSYETFMLINYDSRVLIWGIFQSGTTLES